jgi:hypothetical protein
MKYIKLDPHLDPGEYLSLLPRFSSDLPPGARSFAEDPGHYDFYGRWCVKDLTVREITYGDNGDEITFEIRFAPNPLKHDGPLTIRYSDVANAQIDVGKKPPVGERLGSVALDEILPHRHGCSHEIAFHAGTITIVCGDLRAMWSDIDGRSAERDARKD